MSEASTPQNNATASAATTNTPPGTSKRKKIMLILATIFGVIAIYFILNWLLFSRFVEETENAYVQGNVVQVTPQIAGTVTKIYVDDTDVGCLLLSSVNSVVSFSVIVLLLILSLSLLSNAVVLLLSLYQ